MALYRAGIVKEVEDDVFEGTTTAGGIIAGNVLGIQAENLIFKGSAVESDTMSKKVGHYLLNTATKFLGAHLVSKYGPTGEGTRNFAHGILGSWGEDTVLRLANNGVNPANISIGGYRIMGMGSEAIPKDSYDRVVQENSVLRGELNKAMQVLSGRQIKALPNPDIPGPGGDFKYSGAVSPGVGERQRAYGAMPWTPDVMERERKFGAMPFQENVEKVSRENRFGMMTYAAQNPVSEVFNMR